MNVSAANMKEKPSVDFSVVSNLGARSRIKISKFKCNSIVSGQSTPPGLSQSDGSIHQNDDITPKVVNK